MKDFSPTGGAMTGRNMGACPILEWSRNADFHRKRFSKSLRHERLSTKAFNSIWIIELLLHRKEGKTKLVYLFFQRILVPPTIGLFQWFNKTL